MSHAIHRATEPAAGIGPRCAPVRAKPRPTTARERGAALLLALFVLLLLGVSLALLALSMTVRLDEQRREIGAVRLDLLLDGVMAETVARLALDSRFSGVAPRRDGAGEGWSEVEPLGPEVARVAAGAALGSRRAEATALVRLRPGPPRIVRWRRGPTVAAAAR